MILRPEPRVISIAWASCPRWAVRESADIVELVEQPGGQSAAMLVDVQGTGGSPRRLGLALALEARSLLTSGVSTDLVAQALNQLLCSWRDGQVGATIVLASISPVRQRAEIAGYGDALLAVRAGESWTCQELRCPLAGHQPGGEPERRLIGLDEGAAMVICSDGLARTIAGFLALASAVDAIAAPATIADGLMDAAIARDLGRPSADMATIAIQLAPEDVDTAIERGSMHRPARTIGARS